MMKSYGLLGENLLHSLSPEIHRELGNYRYDLFQVEPDKLDEFFKRREFSGLNVTFPYKKEVMKYCDIITEEAEKIGSVDTIIVREDGKLVGDNTESYGFKHMIDKCGIKIDGKKVLILGNSSNLITVEYVVRSMGAKEITVASENGEINYHNIYGNADANIIINTTTTGMYPNNGERIIDISRFNDICGVMDIIYNPRRTRLICDAEDLHIPNIDGLAMLVAQAYYTEIKFGLIETDEERMKSVYKTMSDRRKNIIFVGLPGCGKTTIAKVIAAKLSRPCIDVDHLIEMQAGMSVASIFMAYGEQYYRELESITLKKITMNGGQIIATDSGAVSSPENQYYIRQNGYVIWLSRPLDELRHNGVYLGRNKHALKRIKEARNPIYENLADIKIEVTDNAEKTVSEIINKIGFEVNQNIF